MLGIHIVLTDQPNCVYESNIDNIITAKSIGALCIMETLIQWEMRYNTIAIPSSTEISSLKGTVSSRSRQEEVAKWGS